MRDACRVSKRVFQRENRAPGVAEHCGRFQVKVPPYHVEILDVGGERHVLGLHRTRRFPTSPLVVVDEPECIRQSVQVGQEIAVVEIDDVEFVGPVGEALPAWIRASRGAVLRPFCRALTESDGSAVTSAPARLATMRRAFMDTHATALPVVRASRGGSFRTGSRPREGRPAHGHRLDEQQARHEPSDMCHVCDTAGLRRVRD